MKELIRIDDFIPFPEELYKLTGSHAPYMDWPPEGPEVPPVPYRLYAIVVHLGTMIGGHYVAYTLVDPDRMFQEGTEVVERLRALDLDIQPSPKKRVWCYCSE